eukprot:g8259.t1
MGWKPEHVAGGDENGYFEAVTLTAYNAVTEIEAAAVDRLTKNLQSSPGGTRLDSVMWSASGSEAIQKALWACLHRDESRDIIIATRHGFHGKKGLAGAVTGSETDHDRDPRVRFISFPMEECDDVSKYDDDIDLAKYEEELARLKEEFGERLCCLITEPYLGGGGSYHPQKSYMKLLENFCRENDILLIFDEVQANFGRTGAMYAFEAYGVEPDIVCLGKGLGNGVPVSAAVGRSDVFASLKYGEGSDTWSANPLACAAVLATLDEFECTDVLDNTRRLSKQFFSGLERLKDTGLICKVRGEGMVFGIECAPVGETPATDGFFCELSRGVITAIDVPNRPHQRLVNAVKRQFSAYDNSHLGVIDSINTGAECRVLVEATESDRHPDLAIYKTAPPKIDTRDLWKIDRFEKERLKKLEKIVELGHDPFGQRFDDHVPIAEAREKCPAEAGDDGEVMRVAGRIMLRRKAGKLRFYDIEDASGRLQLMFSRGDLSEETWELMGQLDLGDLIGVDGPMRRTQTGEVSLLVQQLTILCKSLAQPPEKFHGAKDTEMLLRQRYIDLIYNAGVREKMLLRTKIIDSVRSTLNAENFVEVETPVLHAIAGGAAAKPFITHHNALDIELFQRIALELHLKRLMVGGIERVYEIGRVFRNEGIDATHNPEFTMMEVYQAYGNYESMMDLTEAVVVNAAKVVARGGREPAGNESERLVLPWEEGTIDFTSPWPRKTYGELFAEHAGCDMHDDAAVRARAHELAASGRITPEFIARLDKEDMHPDVVVNEVFEATVEDHLQGPIFVIDYPASICPLTKRKKDNPKVAERFELFIQGMEIANAYTELNDPRLQEELFRTQLAGLAEEESMAKMDHDFIRALKVGMPPAGGLGIGIDRLVMLLTNSQTIRDVIYFPLLRPENAGEGEKKE